MTAISYQLKAERWLDEVILSGSVADLAVADWLVAGSTPAGLGDVAILSLSVYIASIGTPVATGNGRGVGAFILSQDLTTVVDVLGTGQLVHVSVARQMAHIDPDALTLWRVGEQLQIEGPDVDTGITADLNVHIKCVRVRPLQVPATPIQLVR